MMTTVIAKTKAEQQIAEAFARLAPALPGSGWVGDARRAAFQVFSTHGLPHRRVEEWKYTDLRAATKEAFEPQAHEGPAIDLDLLERTLPAALGRLMAVELVFRNGSFKSESRPKAMEQDAYAFGPLSEALSAAESHAWMREHFERVEPAGAAATALNVAFATDGAILRIPDGAALVAPLHLVFVHDAETPAAVTTRNLIKFGPGSSGTVLETHIVRPGARIQANTATVIHVDEGARASHVKLMIGGEGGHHLGTTIARVAAGATYRAFAMTAGTSLVRNQLFVTFAGEGAHLDISGLMLGRGRDHADTTLVVDHAVPRCVSRELFKAVLDGQARAVFQGKVIVRPDAQISDGKQMAQALMLSPDAEFDSKPELEIYADDVVCGHGSTAAEIDEELLFYCRSRGIPLAEARALLIESFVGEALEKIEDEAVRTALAAIARDWLAADKDTGTPS